MLILGGFYDVFIKIVFKGVFKAASLKTMGATIP